MHLTVVTEILQNIRQAEMTPLLQRMYQSEGGSEICDTLMKYLYKGMAQGAPTGASTNSVHGRNITPQATGFTQAGGRNFGGAEGGMSVLLSWHEKVRPAVDGCCNSRVLTILVQLVEMVGPGSIVRVMSDRRTV